MSLRAGTKLGRYQIRSQLGAGGMGEGFSRTTSKSVVTLPSKFYLEPSHPIRIDCRGSGRKPLRGSIESPSVTIKALELNPPEQVSELENSIMKSHFPQ